MRRLLAFAVLVLVPSCSTAPPTRYVLERDLGAWRYRVYQHVLDVDFMIEGNPAVGHTATYVQRANRRSRTIPFANVFVSVYERPAQLTAQIRQQVRALASYEVEVRPLGGGYVFHLDGGEGDRWALWISGRYAVKVGGELDDVPADIVATYMGIYPSDLDAEGVARPGTLSAGEIPEPTEAQPGQEMPAYLQENAPR